MKSMYLFICASVLLGACVSKKKYLESVRIQDESNSQLANCKTKLAACETQITQLESKLKLSEFDISGKVKQIQSLEDQLATSRATNTNLLDRLSDLSVVSKAGAETIKKSLDALDERNKYIKDLTSSVSRKDSINLALVMNLKRSLSDINDEDIQVEVKKGVVYVSLSDKMLFKSGSAEVNASALTVLEKVAKVLNDHNELDILVEGHTDNVPIRTACFDDNWDLSAKRATSIARILSLNYQVAPGRITAGGRGEFVPKVPNDTKENKQANRRTEIIIIPKLDQFFNLLAPLPKE